MDKIFQEIKAERRRQDKKWGAQRNHNNLEWLAILAEEFGEVAKAVTERDVPPIDAISQTPLENRIREELIQAAASCVVWLECINQKRG